jgi:hypothetical protein
LNSKVRFKILGYTIVEVVRWYSTMLHSSTIDPTVVEQHKEGIIGITSSAVSGGEYFSDSTIEFDTMIEVIEEY